MAPYLSALRLRWAMALFFIGGIEQAGAASVESGDSGLGKPPATTTTSFVPAGSGSSATRSRWTRDESRPIKRIFFPPDPPPLGAQINIDSRRLSARDAPPDLAAHVTEPFYAPLSTCLTDFSEASRRKFLPRVAAYTKKRDQLLAELRDVVTNQAGAPAEERLAAFIALRQQQDKALAALESEAEALRAALADKVSWYDLRQWKLGAGSLRERKPEHRVLEFELVRAAAFYQPGLSPAQRRLLREQAMLMQDEIFALESAEASSTAVRAPRLMFFAPDLARLLPQSDMPAAVLDRLQAWVDEKDALREELTATIIAEDKAKLLSNRRRAVAGLADAQDPRLAVLETRAEEIREEYAPAFEGRRSPRPYLLPAEVKAMIDRFFAQRVALQSELDARLDSATLLAAINYRGRDARELRDLQIQERQAVVNRFMEQNVRTLVALDAELERIHGALAACVGEAALRTENRAPNAFLTEYMARYRQSWAYYEYEIAVFEPGLSPTQRRLLMGGAIRWFELPLPRGELQPTLLPLTLLNEEQKLPDARLP
jgi:hypothetical protein